MNLGQKSKREKLLAVITITLVIAVVFYISIIEPQLKTYRSRLEHMRGLQLTLTKMRTDLLIKDRIDEIYRQIKPLIAGVGNEQQEISRFTRDLSDKYSMLDVKIRMVKILPTTDEEFYRRLSVKIEMVGDIRNILNFIGLIESHPQPIKLEKFDIIAREIAGEIKAAFTVSKVVAKPDA